MIFAWFAKRSLTRNRARELYGAVVAQARQPVFYLRLGVADTPEGRYELIALHLVLLLERLGQRDIADEDLRRETLETFITDMDDAMREFGVGDPSVPKKVKKAAGGVYTRGMKYREALSDASDGPLTAAVVDYVYQGRQERAAGALARYVRATVAHLAAQDGANLKSGQVTFGPVASPTEGDTHDAA